MLPSSPLKKAGNEHCPDFLRTHTRHTKVCRPAMRIDPKNPVDQRNSDIIDTLQLVDEILSKHDNKSDKHKISEDFELNNESSESYANPNKKIIERDTPENRPVYFDHISVSEPFFRHKNTLGDFDLPSGSNARLSTHGFQIPSNDLTSRTSQNFRRNMRPPARVPIRESELVDDDDDDYGDDDDGDDDDIVEATASISNENENATPSKISFPEDKMLGLSKETNLNDEFPLDLDKFILSPETSRLFRAGGWQSAMSSSKERENFQMENSKKMLSFQCPDKCFNLKSSGDIGPNVDQNSNSTVGNSFKTKTSLFQCRSQTKCIRPPLRVPVNSLPSDLDETNITGDEVADEIKPDVSQTFLDLLEAVEPISSWMKKYSTTEPHDEPFNSVVEHENHPRDSEFIISSGPSKHDRPVRSDRQRNAHFPSSVVPSNLLQIGRRIFFKHELLGKGGFSKVYRGSSNDVMDCAIKCIDLTEADEVTVASYVGEVSIMKQLQGCVGIIKLYDHHLDVDDKKLYLVMERGEMDLKSFFVNQSKANPDGLLLLVRFCWSQMLRAVESLHDHGIVHWDLKPANFVVVKGQLKVIDFGISKKVLPDHTSVTSDQIMGTYNYMSPEAFNNLSDDPGGEEIKIKVGTKSDVWSLGCILYSMVYGSAPFQKINDPIQKIMAITSKEISFPSTHLGLRVVETLKKCLTRETKKRPSVKELLKDVFLDE